MREYLHIAWSNCTEYAQDMPSALRAAYLATNARYYLADINNYDREPHVVVGAVPQKNDGGKIS